MQGLYQSRHSVLALLIGCYLLPVIVMGAYATHVSPSEHSWSILSIGLFLSLLGSITLFFTTYYWELHLQKASTPVPAGKVSETPSHQILEVEERLASMRSALAEKEQELETLREDALHYQERKDQLVEEFGSSKSSLEEELKQKAILIAEYQQTIADQRAVIAKKQKQLDKHEGKIHDLTYEIKTLLQLAETQNPLPPPEPIVQEEEVLAKTTDEATLQLKRCIDIAQKMTGVNPFANSSSRFRDLPVDNYALDQRRLFDSLQSEHTSPVLVYSPKERKMLFANDQVREMLGWSPDKFAQNFQDLIQDGFQEWKESISHLAPHEESNVQLVMKTKTGNERLVHCKMGTIPTGIFRNHIISILYKV